MRTIKEFVTQRHLHKPEDGKHGDCWMACISTLTGIPMDELPDVNDPMNAEWSSYWVTMWKFLQEKGFNLYCETVAQFKGNNEYCIASGKSPRGDFYHAVVWNDGIAHDPHPDRTGILTIDHFEIIEPNI
ncbi:MAG: hypothetical protein PHT07_21145 [Paludibacter sp.]|nr:hypothetical protein [Paludibacter sp.]